MAPKQRISHVRSHHTLPTRQQLNTLRDSLKTNTEIQTKQSRAVQPKAIIHIRKEAAYATPVLFAHKPFEARTHTLNEKYEITKELIKLQDGYYNNSKSFLEI